MRSIFTAAVVLLGMGTAAHAVDIMAAGPIFFDDRQDNVACGVVNAGPFPVAVLSVQILRSHDPVPYTLPPENCIGVLAPGRACTVVVSIDTAGTHSCVIRVHPSKANVRGTFNLLSLGPFFDVLSHVELR